MLNILTLRHKNGVYLYSSTNVKVLFKIHWIFVIVLSFFVIINFRGTCSSVTMLKGYLVRETTPDLTLALYYTITNHICFIVLFQYLCHMNHESDTK